MTMCDCATCGKAHDEIISKIDHLDQLLNFHQAEVHGTLVEADVIRKWDKATADKVDKLADAIMGPQRLDFDGELHRLSEEGLVDKVEKNTAILQSIDHQVHNGLKFKLRTSDKVLVALIGAMVALIQVFFG